MLKKLKAEKPLGSKKITQKEFEEKVLGFSDKGLTSEKIGEELKKQGFHSKEYDKKISKIIGEKYVNPDIKNVGAKLKRVKEHYEKNKQDKRSMREKDRIFAQLKKLKKYHKIE